MFDIKYSKGAKKFLKNADKIIAKRILNKIEMIQEIPVVHDSKKLKDKNFFRVRAGKFRILYEVDYKNNILGIVKIDKRARVYQ